MRSTGVPLPKNRLSGFVRLAGAGEIIRVTDRDRVVAELGPPQRGRTETAREYGNNDPAWFWGITGNNDPGITIQRGFAATGSFATSRSSVPGHARARHEKTTLDRYSGIVIPKWNPTSYAREGDGTLLRSHHRARRTRLGRLHARPVQILDQRRQPAVATADNPCRSGRGRTTGAGTKLAQKPLSRSKVPQIVRRNRAAGLSALAAMRTVASSARSTGRSATGRRRTR